MSKVFGLGPPKFVGTGDPNTEEVILWFSILDPKFSDKRAKMFESPVSASGHRTWKVKGKHASFEVLVHVSKYEVPNVSTSREFVRNLLLYEDKDVHFYPFKDGFVSGDNLGSPLKDSNNNLITCHIADINFDFKEKRTSEFDICIITFMTNDFYDIKKLVLPT